jgi:hypothetical protein
LKVPLGSLGAPGKFGKFAGPFGVFRKFLLVLLESAMKILWWPPDTLEATNNLLPENAGPSKYLCWPHVSPLMVRWARLEIALSVSFSFERFVRGPCTFPRAQVAQRIMGVFTNGGPLGSTLGVPWATPAALLGPWILWESLGMLFLCVLASFLGAHQGTPREALVAKRHEYH